MHYPNYHMLGGLPAPASVRSALLLRIVAPGVAQPVVAEVELSTF
jgi:hypothetical protein